ncbi:aldolase [Phlyctema vagabunda]|uniref:Aldolase n=1 Tax=Phlyctema vagabunda TaxID=108571 RepID=A0ABR4PCJ6_9HELO
MKQENGIAKTPIQAMSHGGTAIPGLPKFASDLEKRQWQLEHMIGAFRIFARHDYAEGMAGHMSVRDPIVPNAFWINPLGVHFGMLTVADLILVSMDGEILIQSSGHFPGAPINAAGFLIHASIHKAREDVHAICHAHSTYGRAWAAFARPLEMITQDVCNLYGCQAVYADYDGLVLDGNEGENIAKALADNKVCLLMNHGLLSVGTTIDEAAYLFRLMEKSCEIQLQVEAAAANGIPKKIIGDLEASFNYKMTSEAENLYCEFQPEYEYERYLNKGSFAA